MCIQYYRIYEIIAILMGIIIITLKILNVYHITKPDTIESIQYS